MSDRNIHVTQNVGEVKEGGTVIGVQVIYQGEPVVIPSLENIQLHRADLTKIEIYKHWADEFYIREEGKILPLYASPYEDDSGREREDLLQTIRSHQRLLVLGEPGMGKTVAMERMIWETAQSPEPVVPILVQLLYFLGTDLVELIRVALSETHRLNFDNLRSVRAFLRETKCLVLFDGLNEVPGHQRDQVIGAIANLIREYPEHRYVVTSRSQDELWRKLRASELIKDAVVIQNISDAQAQGYLEAHLGERTGQVLYNQLDNSLKALARTPLLLKLIKDACQGSDQLPRNRGELFDRFVMNRLLEREQKLELKETPEVIKKALAHLAFALQLDHRLACEGEWAEKLLAEKEFGAKASLIMSEALLHGLLLRQTLPGRQLLRFIHQSLQEYFVALALYSEVGTEKEADFMRKTSRQLSRRSLTVWAKDPWWSESFVQLAGLLEDADWLARRIMNVSPWLAWWCIEEGSQVQETTRQIIETRSTKLLHSERTADRRRAVQTLGQMKSERVLEPLLIAAADVDREVAGLSGRALVEMGDAIIPLIKRKLMSTNQITRQVVVRYLIHLAHQPADTFGVRLLSEILGQSVVGVSPGSFLMGREEKRKFLHKLSGILEALSEILGAAGVRVSLDSFLMSRDQRRLAYVSKWEYPQHSVILPGYWIGRYPVTVAQWKSFVKESGYKPEEQSLQAPDDHPVRYVSWQDAMAYCKWLGEKSGLTVILPSEAEWEKAARGMDGRLYPWGNAFDKDKCNTRESGNEGTTAVGKYSPAGDSPYGCSDMTGNVWEWTRSKLGPYPYKAEDGRENLEGNHARVLRGGSCHHEQHLASASARNFTLQSSHFPYNGFRVVIHPPAL